MKGFNPNRAFTLIETMIAVTILTLAISGPLFTASRAIVAAQTAREQLTASYLAQEGIEYVRAMRDDAYLNSYRSGGANVSAAAWSDFIAGSNPWSITGCESVTCTLDAYPTTLMGTGSGFSLRPCAGSACAPLFVANGVYTEQGGIAGAAPTPFTRTIQAISVSASDERIVSTVSWDFHNIHYSVTVADHLTPWQ